MEVNRLLNVILLLCIGRITRPAVFSCEIWNIFKVGFSPSKKIFIICFNDSPSKMMENAFYFILKAPRYLNFCLDFLGWRKNGLIRKKDKINFEVYDVKVWLTINYKIHIAQYSTN